MKTRTIKRKKKIRLVKSYKKGWRDQFKGNEYNEPTDPEAARSYKLGWENAEKRTMKPRGIK